MSDNASHDDTAQGAPPGTVFGRAATRPRFDPDADRDPEAEEWEPAEDDTLTSADPEHAAEPDAERAAVAASPESDVFPPDRDAEPATPERGSPTEPDERVEPAEPAAGTAEPARAEHAESTAAGFAEPAAGTEPALPDGPAELGPDVEPAAPAATDADLLTERSPAAAAEPGLDGPATEPESGEPIEPEPTAGAPAGEPTAADTGLGTLPDELSERWELVQIGFVDDPRLAVQNAAGLVSEALAAVERGWRGDDGDVSTDDLRIAFQRYRAVYSVLAG
jgi:hypothetical protein